MIFGSFFLGFSLIFILVTSPIIRPGFWKTKEVLRDKTYSIVEGKVENFDPMPEGGHKRESFTINGVEFNYSDFDLSVWGFNNAASHGGPINKNGQYLRIGYIWNDYYERNVIVLIQEKE